MDDLLAFCQSRRRGSIVSMIIVLFKFASRAFPEQYF